MPQKESKTVKLRQIWQLIPEHKRRGAVGVLFCTVLLALLDFIGVAAMVSVLLVVLEPETMMANGLLGSLYAGAGFASMNTYIFAVCAAVLMVIVLKSVFSLIVSNWMNKYLLSLYQYYSNRMFGIYLSKGLLFIRQHHTSQLVNNVNGVCLRFTDGVFGQMLGIVSNVILLVLLLGVLLLYDPLIVAIAIAVFLPLALLYSLIFRRRMAENGKTENRLFVQQNKTMYETLRGYSDIEINNASRYVSRKFSRGLRELSDYRRRAANVRKASGRVVEFSLVLGVVVMIVAGLSVGTDMGSLKISLGVFAVAAYKIVPSVSSIVNGWVEYKRNSFAAETLGDTFAENPCNPEAPEPSTERMPFDKKIGIEGISFSYADGKKVLDNLSLTVCKGEKIGIRGYSGAGKTTLFNIICGFFKPDKGCMTVDGVPIDEDNVRLWQNNIAYVSQEVFIPDISIAENIAFGTDRSQIDQQRLSCAIRAASLSELVESLPEGIDTVTGESGCRLSGGQRQRIGIARALYKEASLLLFDEATSSLDSRTEQEIVRSIEKLSFENKDLTMLIISHREQTLAFCDRIIDID